MDRPIRMTFIFLALIFRRIVRGSTFQRAASSLTVSSCWLSALLSRRNRLCPSDTAAPEFASAPDLDAELCGCPRRLGWCSEDGGGCLSGDSRFRVFGSPVDGAAGVPIFADRELSATLATRLDNKSSIAPALCHWCKRQERVETARICNRAFGPFEAFKGTI